MGSADCGLNVRVWVKGAEAAGLAGPSPADLASITDLWFGATVLAAIGLMVVLIVVLKA